MMDERRALTPREKEVAAMVADGKSYKAIAREIGVSVRTVHAHIRNAASVLPIDGKPRHKLTVFWLSIGQESDAA